MRYEALENSSTKASRLLKAIANEQRLKVLNLISDKEMTVSELESHLNLSQSSLSQHLRVLRDAELVKTRREAQQRFYSIKNDVVHVVLSTMDSISAAAAFPVLKSWRR